MYEPIRFASPATLRQSGTEAFQKRYSFVNALLELEITRQFTRQLRAMLVCTILLSALTVVQSTEWRRHWDDRRNRGRFDRCRDSWSAGQHYRS
jgi:hypothetical protein